MKLTKLELTVLESLFQSAKNNGHDFGFPQDARKVVTAKQLSGVISSLTKKNIIEVFENPNKDARSNKNVPDTMFKWVSSIDAYDHDLASYLAAISKEEAPIVCETCDSVVAYVNVNNLCSDCEQESEIL